MKKLISLAIVAMLSFSIIPIKADNSIQIKYKFSVDVNEVAIDGKVYSNVEIKNGGVFGKVGEPALPAAPSYILIPYGKDVGGIKVEGRDKVEMSIKNDVMPIGRAQPLDESFHLIPREGNVYKTASPFPGKLYDKVGIYYFRGFKILVLRLYPVQYIPATKKLIFYRQMDVKLSLKDGGISQLFRGLKEDENDVMKMVDNPSIAKTYPCHKTASYDLLIITSKKLERAFEPLKEWHDDHGENTIIVTMDEIGKNADDVRNYIRSAYKNLGISYVLLGGDVDVVPAKMLWASGYDENVTYYSTTMPSDLYYECLDGTYNYNHNDKWGEPDDGPGGKDVDLIAEVYAGRASVDTIQEANNFVKKTIAYMDSHGNYLKNVLMVGEYLGDYGIASWGGNYMDQLINGSDANGYTTVGIPANKFNIEKLYDRDWKGNYWSAEELENRINNGVHIINHLGHSSVTYNMRLTISSVDNLKNNNYCFIYSQGCYAGAFDEEDCIAEEFTNSPHGAFAGVWNARYGFFWSFSTDGDSQRYHRHLWDEVFGKHVYEIGRANQLSKEANLYMINRSMMRWCYYELNLFGDPLTKFNIDNAPEKPSTPSGVKRGKVGNTYNFSTSTTDIDGDNIYYKWDWGDGNYSDWIGPYKSGEAVTASHTWKERGRYDVRVIAKDEYGMTSEWSDPLVVTMPYIQMPQLNIIKWLSLFFDFLKSFSISDSSLQIFPIR